MLDSLQQINLVNENIISPSSFYVCLFKVLKVLADSFLSEILSEQIRKTAILDMLFVNGEELMGAVMVGGCLCHSNHKITCFNLFSVRRKKTNHLVDYPENLLLRAYKPIGAGLSLRCPGTGYPIAV